MYLSNETYFEPAMRGTTKKKDRRLIPLRITSSDAFSYRRYRLSESIQWSCPAQVGHCLRHDHLDTPRNNMSVSRQVPRGLPCANLSSSQGLQSHPLERQSVITGRSGRTHQESHPLCTSFSRAAWLASFDAAISDPLGSAKCVSIEAARNERQHEQQPHAWKISF